MAGSPLGGTQGGVVGQQGANQFRLVTIVEPGASAMGMDVINCPGVEFSPL